MKRPRICILSFSDIHRDGRVLRQIEYACREYVVDVIGYGNWNPPWPNVRYREIKRIWPGLVQRRLYTTLLLAGRVLPHLWLKAYWLQQNRRNALKLLLQKRYHLIHANDLLALPVAVTAAEQTGAKVLFDAHEYSPGQAIYQRGKSSFVKPDFIGHLLRTYGPRVDTFITVAPGIANLYQKTFGLAAEIIMSTPAYIQSEFQPANPDRIRLIHHGAAIRERQLETMVEMMGFLDERYTLDFMLIERKKKGYIPELQRFGESVGPGRIFFNPPVAPKEIVPTLTKYDIGLSVIPTQPLSYKYSLPNKFFEYIVAGLGVVIGPSPEMTPFVQKYGLGAIATGFDAKDLAKAIKILSTNDINQMKRNSLQAAQSLNADVEMGKLMNIYQKVVS